MLHRTIGIQSAGNTLSDIGMTFHIIEEELECSWLECHVAVDDKMILGSGLADCLIMSCTIAHIVDTIINDTNRRHERRLLQTCNATVEFALGVWYVTMEADIIIEKLELARDCHRAQEPR